MSISQFTQGRDLLPTNYIIILEPIMHRRFFNSLTFACSLTCGVKFGYLHQSQKKKSESHLYYSHSTLYSTTEYGCRIVEVAMTPLQLQLFDTGTHSTIRTCLAVSL